MNFIKKHKIWFVWPVTLFFCLIFSAVIWGIYYFFWDKFYTTIHWHLLLQISSYLDILTLHGDPNGTFYLQASFILSVIISLFCILYWSNKRIFKFIISATLISLSAFFIYLHLTRPLGVTWCLCKVSNNDIVTDIPTWYYTSINFNIPDCFRRTLPDGNSESGHAIYKAGNVICFKSEGQTLICQKHSDSIDSGILKIDKIRGHLSNCTRYEKKKDTLIFHYDNDNILEYYIPYEKLRQSRMNARKDNVP